SSARRLRRSPSQGCQAGGIAGRAGDEVRAGHQRSDRQDARADRARQAPRRRRRGDRMNRREVVTLLGGAVAWPLAARAQQSERGGGVGVLMTLTADDDDASPRVTALAQGLQQLGWTAGRNVRIDYRWGAVDADRSRRYATELLALAPDVILASSSPAVAALQQ